MQSFLFFLPSFLPFYFIFFLRIHETSFLSRKKLLVRAKRYKGWSDYIQGEDVSVGDHLLEIKE